MMIYCRNRSMRLPRKARRKVINNNSASVIIPPYRATQHADKPSQLEKRSESGRWLTKEEWEKASNDARSLQEALVWLESF